MNFSRASGALCLLLILLASPVLAISPRLSHLSPPGGQTGTEIDVKLHGARLTDTREIVFYQPGIELIRFEARSNAVFARFKIRSDCRLGEHAIRLRCTGGVSELKTFYVGPFTNLAEVEPNTIVSKAQVVPLNVTVTGIMGADDLDHYRVRLKKGERLNAEIEAIRLGRFAFDAALTVMDTEGQVLQTADDSSLALQDPILSFVAPSDGEYLVQVRETSYGGNADYVYRLHLGNFPRPMVVYPAGGPAGQTVNLRFLGDPLGSWSQEVSLPSRSMDRFPVFASANSLKAPSPNWIRVSNFENVLEKSPNQTRAEATVSPVPPPVALNGILLIAGQKDWFRFPAVKGQNLDVTVYARRLRSPIDTLLEVYDSKGKSLGQNDDANGPDSSLKFTPPADGDYFLSIRDHLDRSGADYVYRAEIVPSQPSLHLSIPQVARNDSQTRQTIVVPRGNRFATVMAARRNNFTGDLFFQAEELPAGISMTAPTLLSQADATPIVFEAESGAMLAGKMVNLEAVTRGTNLVQGSFRHDLELVRGPNNTSYYGTRVDRLYVAVVDEVPFSIRLEEPKIPLVQGGTMDVKIIAERKNGFDEPINLKMLWNPPGVASLPDLTIPKGKNEVEYRLNANVDAQLRTWPMAFIGSSTVEGGTVFISTQLGKLEVSSPWLLGKIDNLSVPPGETARLVCKLDQKQTFAGSAKIKLMGLPEKVTANEPTITAESKEVVFDLKVDPSCPLGSHKALFCTLLIPAAGGEVPHTLAQGGILRIVPPKKSAPSAEAEKKVAAK